MNETNFVRVKIESPQPSGYSAPVSLSFDPTVGGASTNQIRTLSISRSGTNIILRWALNQANGKQTKLYFKRADNNTTYLLTPQALNSSLTSFTLDSQALASPCGNFWGTQFQTSIETGPGPSSDLGSSRPGEQGTQDGCGGTQPPSPSPAMKFVNSYRHLDHLGSLRIARGDIGAPEGGVSSALDLYPFGSPFASAVANSRRQFTGHERDAGAGMDYLLARYVSGGQLRFLSTDPGAPDTATESIQRWNKFSYAVNNPLQMIDPDGRDSFLCTRPLAFYEKAGHMFVTTGGAAPGDRNAAVNSVGDRGDDITGKVDGNTKGFSEGTNKEDHAAWLSAGQPGSTTECVPIPAPDAVVQSLADSVVEDLPYSALPGLLGDNTLGASTNSNSAAQAVANQAAGQPIPSPESLPVPGAANWTSVGFDTNKDGKRDPSRVPSPPPPPPPPVPTHRPMDKR